MGKKRRLGDDGLAIGADEAQVSDASKNIDNSVQPPKKRKKDKKDKKKKKKKKKKKDRQSRDSTTDIDKAAVETVEKAPKQSAPDESTPDATDKTDEKPKALSKRQERRQAYWDKKQAEREAKQAKKSGANATEGDEAPEETPQAEAVNAESANEDADAPQRTWASQNRSRDRYILFIGNMSYSTKREHIYKHFGRFEGLIDVRLLTDKKTGRPKGTAFIEYDNRESHGKALGLHHSKMVGRVVNVELTVGGGGRKENRMSKLRDKNKRHLGTGGPESINSIPLGSGVDAKDTKS